MKIVMTQTRNIAGYGLKSEGDEVELPDALGRQLIQQNMAIEFRRYTPQAERVTRAPRRVSRKPAGELLGKENEEK